MGINVTRISRQFLSAPHSLVFGLSFFTFCLVFPTASWSQPPESDLQEKTTNQLVVPASQGQTITDIQVKFVDRNNQPITGESKPSIIIQEFDLEPGDTYDAELAKKGLRGVNNLIHVTKATISLEPSARDNDVVMVVTVEEKNGFFFRFGQTLPPPTALKGPGRPIIINPLSNRANGIGGGIRIGWRNIGGTNKAITLGSEFGPNLLGFDFDYRQFIKHNRGYAFNFFGRQGKEPEFDNGTEVNLPNNNDPWIDRTGGGGEYFFSHSS